MKKILYIFDATDANSRLPVATCAKDKGHHVTLGLIGGENKHEGFPAHLIPKPLGIKGALLMLRHIQILLRQERPDILHTVTLKYAFFCALAALTTPRLTKIYTLAGLGYLFHGHTTKATMLRFLIKPALAFLFKRPNTRIIFQNPDDQALMIAQGCVHENDCTLIRGSGVDLKKFLQTPNPDDPPLILMPTRLVQEKGIQVFIDAAKILAAKNIRAQYQIAGGETTHNPRAISAAQMHAMLQGSPVTWLGRVENIPALLARATLIVYPSYYGEGIPRVLLEACAAGRAIITTDHTGCREAVTHAYNGLLVPIKDAQATAAVIETLLNDPARRAAMEKHSRRRAETEFDITLIAQKTAALYDS